MLLPMPASAAAFSTLSSNGASCSKVIASSSPSIARSIHPHLDGRQRTLYAIARLKASDKPSSFTYDALDADRPQGGFWLVPEMGFKWVTSEAPLVARPPGRWLVPRGKWFRRYAILRRRKAIAADFLSLARSVTEESILSFANQWGDLGVDRANIIYGARDAEPLAAWSKHAATVAGIWHLWQLVRGSNEDALSAFVRWTRSPLTVEFRAPVGPDGRLTTESDEARAWLRTSVSAASDPEGLLKRWDNGDVLEPSRLAVCSAINNALRGTFSRALLPYYNNSVRYMPTSLVAVIYSHLQDEVAGAKGQERECPAPGCPNGGWFVPRRSNHRYCDASCRSNFNYHHSKKG